jgi:hypothetical protein
MDLIIIKARSGGMYVCSGSGDEWLRRDDVLLIVPNAGWCQAEVWNALTPDSWVPIRAPLAVVLGEVGLALDAHGPNPTESNDEPWAWPATICWACRSDRDPGAEPGAICPNCERLEREASSPARAHERDRSRSPARAASPSAEASR